MNRIIISCCQKSKNLACFNKNYGLSCNDIISLLFRYYSLYHFVLTELSAVVSILRREIKYDKNLEITDHAIVTDTIIIDCW